MINIEFKNIDIDSEVDLLYYFIFQGGSWNEYVFKKHPQLKKALKLKTKKDRLNFIREYVLKYHSKNKEIIEINKKTYESNWKKIEKNVFIEMEKIIGTKFPINKKILSYISINPICPRFLNEWSFAMYYKLDVKKSKEVIMHECLHFLYFKKWKEMFPKAKEETFDSPHIVWHLSELVAPILLNDPKIQKYLKSKAGFYEEHEKILIDGKSVPILLGEIYNKSDSFEEFIKSAYKIIKKHKKCLEANC